jgi:hypothetical protein
MDGKPESGVYGSGLMERDESSGKEIGDTETVEIAGYECCICDSRRFLSISETYSRSARDSSEVLALDCVDCGSRVEIYGPVEQVDEPEGATQDEVDQAVADLGGDA